jgi:hypothetical protein
MSLPATQYAWAAHCPSSTAKLVLLAIADAINREGIAWVSIDTLSARCQLSRRSVIDQVVLLEDRGLLLCQRDPGRSTIYSLPPVQDVHPTCEAGSPLPVNEVHPCNTITCEAGSPPPVQDVHLHPCRTFTPPVNVMQKPVNDVHPNRYNREEVQKDRTLRGSGEAGSRVNDVHSPLEDSQIAQIDRIIRSYPMSRGRTESERILAAELRAGTSLDEVEARTAAIALVIANDYTEADRLRFIVASNRFFGDRRWQEDPADWRLAKAVAREKATTPGGGKWAGRVNSQLSESLNKSTTPVDASN